jgi:hopanoid C-2 methylase
VKKRRIFIVNCYFDETRLPIARTNKFPLAMAPAYLAGGFSKELCELRIYNEQSSGPLRDESLIGWPDMLVLTGLTNAFDRMLHLTAYARTQNPEVIVVAGGPAIRALPRLSGRYFNYVCQGDLEQIKDVILDAFGAGYVAEEMVPRFDLAHSGGQIGYAETSRNCNFACSFCTLTSEGNKYVKLNLQTIEKQILTTGKKRTLLFLDNNFYGNDREYFVSRIDIIRGLWKKGHFKGWAALVTNDFFLNDENLSLARESGCLALFSGVESFDIRWLQNARKLQNTRMPQSEMIRKCLDAGIVFLYGMMLDPFTRSIQDLRSELEFIFDTPEISLPSYLSIPVPIPGTPFFYENVEKGALLPMTKLRDLDSTTISMWPLGPIDEAVAFVEDIASMRRYRKQIVLHTAAFLRRYRSIFSLEQLLIVLGNALNLSAPVLFTAPRWARRSTRHRRTYVSTTEPVDAVYSPSFPVSSKYERYFQPTMVTDRYGGLADDVSELLERKGIKRWMDKLTSPRIEAARFLNKGRLTSTANPILLR